MAFAFKPGLAGITALLLASVVLSGCTDAGSKAATASSMSAGGPAPVLSTGPADCAADGNAKDCQKTNDPKRHYHHYWGDRTEVDVFNGELTLDQDPFMPLSSSCRTIGHKEFDPEMDGNDANPDDPPVNVKVNPPRADVVFAGTVRLDVKLLAQSLVTDPADAALQQTLFFRYKPANLNFYEPENTDCGIPLDLNRVVSIPVAPQAADPPHQWAVSRWKFFVLAGSETPGSTGSPLPTLGSGTFKIEITAINGGENTLDPAHPNLWGTSMEYDLGCTTGKTDHMLVVHPPSQLTGTPFDKQPQEPLTDIRPLYGRIVPLLTQKVVVTVDWKYTGNVPGTKLVLQYFGADTNTYQSAGNTVSTNPDTYEILDEKGLKADPPYEDKSLWRFQLMPVSPVAADQGGGMSLSAAEFTGEFTLCATAIRDPNAVLE